MLARRFGEIVALDRAVGRPRRYLREAGLAENTLVWYVSDNGAPKDGAVVAELRGFKGTLDEGGVRAPSVLQWPGRVKPGTASYPAVTSDILPTLAEWLGRELPARTLDGVSLVAAIEGREQARPRPVRTRPRAANCDAGPAAPALRGALGKKDAKAHSIEKFPGERGMSDRQDVRADHVAAR